MREGKRGKRSKRTTEGLVLLGQAGIPEADINKQVEVLCASDAFDNRPRSRDLLDYLVREALAGRVPSQTDVAKLFGLKGLDSGESNLRGITKQLRDSLAWHYKEFAEPGEIRLEFPERQYLILTPRPTAKSGAPPSPSSAEIPLEPEPSAEVPPPPASALVETLSAPITETPSPSDTGASPPSFEEPATPIPGVPPPAISESSSPTSNADAMPTISSADLPLSTPEVLPPISPSNSAPALASILEPHEGAEVEAQVTVRGRIGALDPDLHVWLVVRSPRGDMRPQCEISPLAPEWAHKVFIFDAAKDTLETYRDWLNLSKPDTPLRQPQHEINLIGVNPAGNKAFHRYKKIMGLKEPNYVGIGAALLFVFLLSPYYMLMEDGFRRLPSGSFVIDTKRVTKISVPPKA